MVAAIHAAERSAAKAAGERFYETGKPCKHGHTSKRYTGTGLCAVCATEATLRVQAKKREHPQRVIARAEGLAHYSTGTPCKNGHDRRLVSNGACAECSLRFVAKYQSARPGLAAEWARIRRAKNPAAHRAESMKWYRGNLDKARQIALRWRAKNPERRRELALIGAHKRRARTLANGGSFTTEDIAIIFSEQGGRCAGCSALGCKLTIDHYLPIVLGGGNHPHNLQLLCLPCNRKKGSSHPTEWLKTLTLRGIPCS